MSRAAKGAIIFLLSLPLLALAVVMVPLGLVLDIFGCAVWLPLIFIGGLRTGKTDFGIFRAIPLLGFKTYFEITGFCPGLARRIEPY